MMKFFDKLRRTTEKLSWCVFFVTFWQKAALDVFRGRRTVYSQLTRRGDKPRAGNQQRRNHT